MGDDGPKVRKLIPLIWVKDIATTVAFYRDRLGFTMAGSWEEDGKLNWCRMGRGDAALMFQEPYHGAMNLAVRPRGVILYSICEDADMVVVMQKGEIIQVGTHTELLAVPGLYRRMYMRQMGMEQLDAALAQIPGESAEDSDQP